MTMTPAKALAGETWMAFANCAYGVLEMVSGIRVFRPDGTAVMDYEQFQLKMDQLFHGGHDDKPSSGDESRRLVRAIEVCLSCPVRVECLRYACESEHSITNGVYGATTRWERRTVMRSALFSSLTHEEKVRVLERLVWAKAMGWARPSTPVDHAERAFRRLTDDEWEAFARESEARDEAWGDVA